MTPRQSAIAIGAIWAAATALGAAYWIWPAASRVAHWFLWPVTILTGFLLGVVFQRDRGSRHQVIETDSWRAEYRRRNGCEEWHLVYERPETGTTP